MCAKQHEYLGLFMNTVSLKTGLYAAPTLFLVSTEPSGFFLNTSLFFFPLNFYHHYALLPMSAKQANALSNFNSIKGK
jgi:hypothetical protein